MDIQSAKPCTYLPDGRQVHRCGVNPLNPFNYFFVLIQSAKSLPTVRQALTFFLTFHKSCVKIKSLLDRDFLPTDR